MEIKSSRLPILAAIASVLPFFLCIRQFRLLYWFHDDWHLLNDWTNLGASAFILQPMAEHFAPVFKLLWMGAVHATGGSYFAMLALGWATHLAVMLLFATLLTHCEFSTPATIVSVLMTGLAWTNIETLGWATQWSVVLCILFLMIAWVSISSKGNAWLITLAVLAAALSAATFALGILAGIVLAAFVLLMRRGLRLAALLFAPAAIFLVAYRHLADTYPNFQAIDSARLVAMAAWAGKYLLLNPLYLLISYPHREVNALAILLFGALKILIVAAGLIIATRMQRSVLWTLLLLDIGAAALLTAGRYTTGSIGVVSSRYQYLSLLTFSPFAGLILARLPKPAMIAASLAMVLGISLPWPRHMDRWSYERGVELRQSVASTPDDQRFGLPTITAGRARELIAKYGLH